MKECGLASSIQTWICRAAVQEGGHESACDTITLTVTILITIGGRVSRYVARLYTCRQPCGSAPRRHACRDSTTVSEIRGARALESETHEHSKARRTWIRKRDARGFESETHEDSQARRIIGRRRTRSALTRLDYYLSLKCAKHMRCYNHVCVITRT